MVLAEKRKSLAEPAKPLLLGGTAIKPPEHHGWDRVRVLIYEKETGKIFTRTPKSWALIIIFYLIYYTCLACFWYAMLRLFFITMPNDQPKYTLDASIIGVNPGVGMRPQQPDKTIDSSMLYLKMDAQNEKPTEDNESPSNIDWAGRYKTYLEKYDNKTGTRVCPDGEGGETGKDACQFEPSVLGACSRYPYGYQLGSGQDVVNPCVLLKINRIFSWAPEPYTDEDLEPENQDPDDPIPDHIVKRIRADRNKIYLDCRGENPFDREILVGKMNYFPADQGINFKYFPYNHAHKNYHNPLVAVQFNNLMPGVLHHVECRLWAKDVIHGKKHREGLVHFEIILEQEYEE